MAAEAAQAAAEPENELGDRPLPQPAEASAPQWEQAAAVEERPVPAPGAAGEADTWRERALRLQAEMDNYRRRQQRLAQEQIEEERRRLLGAFLGIVDDLERALDAPQDGGDGLRQGVQLTHRAAMQLLKREGVEQILAQHQPFDPNWHEAVATIGRSSDTPAETVVRVMEPGYRLGERLLRPARVIVAV